MSHNRNVQYNKFGNNNHQRREEEPVVNVEQDVNENVEPIDATVPEPEVTVEPPMVESTPELPKAVTGFVSGCKKLNVRNRPSTTAAIITVITEGTEVEIAQPVLDAEFYKVTLADNTVGYCMQKFIAVK